MKEIVLIGNASIHPRQSQSVEQWSKIRKVNTYDELLKERGFEDRPIVIAEVGIDGVDINKFIWPSNPILAIGTEAGINAKVLRVANCVVEIPMYGVCTSLNVSAATAILLFHHRLQYEAGHPERRLNLALDFQRPGVLGVRQVSYNLIENTSLGKGARWE